MGDATTQSASGSRAGRERGSASLELAILTPVLLIIFGMMIAAGRVAIADGTIQQVAGDAARAASLSRTAADAQGAAESLVTSVVGANGLPCTPVVSTNTTEFSNAPGTPGYVTVEVSCTVTLSDLAVPGLPGSVTLTGTGRSVLDTYRATS
nr:pilus assembly protein [Actinomycetales bacterium]